MGGGLEDDVDLYFGGDDDAFRHRRLHKMRYALFHWSAIFIGELGNFRTIPCCAFASHTRLVPRLDSTTCKRDFFFSAASSMALGLCPVRFSCLSEAAACHAFCPLVFHDTPVRHLFTQTWLERHKSFVFRLLRTAVYCM